MADSVADIPGSAHAAGTVHAVVDKPGSGASVPAVVALRDVPAVLEPVPLGLAAFALRPKSAEVAEPLHDNLREVAADSAEADGPDSSAAVPKVVPVRVGLAAAAVAALELAEHLPRAVLPDSVLQFDRADQHAPDHLHVLPEDHSDLHHRASEGHFRVAGRAAAEAAPGCCAADRPNSPDKPGSCATPHDTTCTRSPCPCSGSPEWSESGRRFRPKSSECASDLAAAEAHLAASARRDLPDCPGWAAAGIVAAASTRPTCLFFSFAPEKRQMG